MTEFLRGRAPQLKAIVASLVALAALLQWASPEVIGAGAAVLMALLGLVDSDK